jgi:hypothetical protein
MKHIKLFESFWDKVPKSEEHLAHYYYPSMYDEVVKLDHNQLPSEEELAEYGLELKGSDEYGHVLSGRGEDIERYAIETGRPPNEVIPTNPLKSIPHQKSGEFSRKETLANTNDYEEEYRNQISQALDKFKSEEISKEEALSILLGREW